MVKANPTTHTLISQFGEELRGWNKEQSPLVIALLRLGVVDLSVIDSRCPTLLYLHVVR